MNRKHRLTWLTGMTLTGIAALLVIPTLAMTESPTMHHKNMAAPTAPQKLTLETLHEKQVPELSQALDEAIRLLQAGKQQDALAQLQKARQSLEAIKTTLAAHVKPAFANTRCPIMGSPIHPDRVTKALTREYQGKQIAFCCGGCPNQWDKLTDAQKQQKFSQAAPKEEAAGKTHNH